MDFSKLTIKYYNYISSDIINFSKELNQSMVLYNRDVYNVSSDLLKVMELHNIPNIFTVFEKTENSICPLIKPFVEIKIDNNIFYMFTIKDDEFRYIKQTHVSINTYNDLIFASQLIDVIFGESVDKIKLFQQKLKEVAINISIDKIYLWSDSSLCYFPDKSYYHKSINDLIGLDKYYNRIKQDFEIYKLNEKELIRLGLTSGINYLLYGKPGTGKSSFVKALCSDMKLPIYVTSLVSARNEKDIKNMLIPCSTDYDDKYKYKIVLIEDFDRYLNNKDIADKTLSPLLNSLDGIFPSYGVIRFFTVNNTDVFKKYTALISRIKRSFIFKELDNESLKLQIKNIFIKFELNDEDINKFIEIIQSYKFSVREITNYLVSFINSNDPLKDAIDNINDWITDIDGVIKFEATD